MKIVKISIFGIGYVGLTSAVCLAERGNQIVMVDVNPKKVELLTEGCSPISNEELKNLLKKNWLLKRISATNDSNKAITETDVSIICVGTPSDINGEVDLKAVFTVFTSIGEVLREKNSYHLIILRSTSPPGTTKQGLELIEKISGKQAGHDFGGSMNPEFLRGWSLIDDFLNPPYTIIGEFDKKSGDLTESVFQGVTGEVIRTQLEIAEMVKYVCNAFHALKASFANEIGRVCKQLNINSKEVMHIFSKDTKLNISESYLKPGFAFGGSCLPKDVKAIVNLGERIGAKPLVLDSILKSNALQVDFLIDRLVVNLKKKRVGIVGVTYHKNSDDLRNSPIFELIEKLLKKHFQVLVYDDNVDFDKLLGANKEAYKSLPFNLKDLFVFSLKKLIDSVDVVIIAHAKPDLKKIINNSPPNQLYVDLGDFYFTRHSIHNYDGICW